MTAPTMLERVADAIMHSPSWSSFWHRDDARAFARAAIAEMREADGRMMDAGYEKLPRVASREIREAYRAMMDAALRAS